MQLQGSWVAAPADEDLRRSFADHGFDDSGWEPITVPGHWRSTPAFADLDGPMLYRTGFAPSPSDGETSPSDDATSATPSPIDPDTARDWLILDGIFYQGDVWLDGGYLGDTEGYFFHHTFEITDALSDRDDHVLAVETTCAPPSDKTAKRNLTGVFQHGNYLDPDWNPGGIWRPVWTERTGPVRIRHLAVTCQEATEESALVKIHAVVDTREAGPVDVRTTVGDRVDQHDLRSLAAGTNQVEWTVTIDTPELWWPHTLGAQPLEEVAVEVGFGPEQVSHRRTRRLGLRSIEMRDWVLHINGERLFVKGSNQGPTRMALAEATPDELRRDVDLAVDAGLDLLRIHAHITRDELYDAADEAGLLLWQDMPLQWAYARGLRKQAAHQAGRAVTRLGHHPSIVIWCGHNEPFPVDLDPAQLAEPEAVRRTGRKVLAAQQLPSWNRTVLDRSIKRALEKADGSRPVVAHSGVHPHLPLLDGTDSHLYFGWYHGHERGLPRFAARIPRLVRFVSEFGAQAVPEEAEFCGPEDWPDLDWDRLGHTHNLQKVVFDRHVAPGEYDTFDGWRAATQAYQATVIKHHIETLRRLKYRPVGGFAQFCFADAHPAVTWSVLGHDRQPKAGYEALRDACQPVIVVADRPPELVRRGDELVLDVHAVSDLHVPLVGATIEARLSWEGGDQTWTFGGDLPADDCVRIGTLEAKVPQVGGAVVLDLTLTAVEAGAGEIQATNRYHTSIWPPT